jgi:hypothetical protein
MLPTGTPIRTETPANFRKLYPDVPIIPLQFLCERLQGACSLFDDPLVRRKLKEEIPEVYENMVKLGVITSERKE